MPEIEASTSATVTERMIDTQGAVAHQYAALDHANCSCCVKPEMLIKENDEYYGEDDRSDAPPSGCNEFSEGPSTANVYGASIARQPELKSSLAPSDTQGGVLLQQPGEVVSTVHDLVARPESVTTVSRGVSQFSRLEAAQGEQDSVVRGTMRVPAALGEQVVSSVQSMSRSSQVASGRDVGLSSSPLSSFTRSSLAETVTAGSAANQSQTGHAWTGKSIADSQTGDLPSVRAQVPMLTAAVTAVTSAERTGKSAAPTEQVRQITASVNHIEPQVLKSPGSGRFVGWASDRPVAEPSIGARTAQHSGRHIRVSVAEPLSRGMTGEAAVNAPGRGPPRHNQIPSKVVSRYSSPKATREDLSNSSRSTTGQQGNAVPQRSAMRASVSLERVEASRRGSSGATTQRDQSTPKRSRSSGVTGHVRNESAIKGREAPLLPRGAPRTRSARSEKLESRVPDVRTRDSMTAVIRSGRGSKTNTAPEHSLSSVELRRLASPQGGDRGESRGQRRIDPIHNRRGERGTRDLMQRAVQEREAPVQRTQAVRTKRGESGARDSMQRAVREREAPLQRRTLSKRHAGLEQASALRETIRARVNRLLVNAERSRHKGRTSLSALQQLELATRVIELLGEDEEYGGISELRNEHRSGVVAPRVIRAKNKRGGPSEVRKHAKLKSLKSLRKQRAARATDSTESAGSGSVVRGGAGGSSGMSGSVSNPRSVAGRIVSGSRSGPGKSLDIFQAKTDDDATVPYDNEESNTERGRTSTTKNTGITTRRR
jgi:hypothetical protein